MATDAEKTTFYDHFAQDRPTRLGARLAGGVARRIFDFARIRRGDRVLEIGPGRGVFTELCLRQGALYRAIEPNQEMAEQLRRRGVEVVSAIVPPVPDLGQTFDVVVMNSVIEHMNTMTDALELTRQVHTLLNPGGRFVLYAPDYANWRHHFFIGDFSHSYITSWRRLEELLISAGFDRVEGCYQTATFRGVSCFLVSGAAAWLPFGWLDVLFPRSKVVRKLYKIQIGLLRRVLVAGVKKGEAAEEQA
jgi:SAM-dependent methyltransferase